MSKDKKKKKGFTLIELLVAIVILGVIMTISGVVIMNAIKNSKEKSYIVTVNEIESNANNYLTENSDRLFFLTDNVNNYEYQCVTVQNLVDFGYLKDTIEKSKVDDDTNVNKKDYVYIVRNINTKAIEKTVYVPKSDIETGNTCARAVLAQGDISFTVIPNDDNWYQSKDVVINYRIKNVNDLRTLNEYEYNYMYYGNSEIKNNGGNAKTVKVTSNGTMTANIMYGDTEITTGSINVGNIDTIKPVIAEKYSGSNVVRKAVTIPLTFTDEEGGSKPNYDSFTKDDLIVTIGGNNITNFELKHGTYDNYTLTINDIEHAGDVVITIAANKVEDNAKNGNVETVLKPKVSFSNVYKITFDGNGGTPSSISINVTYGGTYGTLPTATRSGYTFNGWYTTKSGGNKIETSTIFNKTDDQTLYASWTENVATLSYNANGHGTAPASVTMKYTTETKASTAISASGYIFKEWNTKADGSGTSYAAGARVKAANVNPSNITLYAIWKNGDYTVTLVANASDAYYINQSAVDGDSGHYIVGRNNSSRVDFNGTTFKIQSGATYGSELRTLNRYGSYVFDGWYTSNEKTCEETASSSNYGFIVGGYGNSNSSQECVKYSYSGTKVTASSKFNYDHDITLYAQWHYVKSEGARSNNSDPGGPRQEPCTSGWCACNPASCTYYGVPLY